MKPHELPAWLDRFSAEPCGHCGGTGKIWDNKAIGRALRKMREGQNLSVREVARRLKLSTPYVSDLELGRRGWNTARVARYLIACGLWVAK